MTSILCKECGQPVSDETQICPNCGASLEQTTLQVKKSNRQPKIIWIVMGVLAAVTMIANLMEKKDAVNISSQVTTPTRTVQPLTSQEYAVIHLMMTHEIKKFWSGKNAIITNAIIESAPALFKAYDQNEVAADQKYRNNSILVNGTIRSISKDALDQPYITLAGGGYLGHVYIRFAKDIDITRISSLRKGDRTVFYCQGNGMIMNSPQLKDCAFPDDAFNAILRMKYNALRKLEQQGGNADNVIDLVIPALLIATELPENSPCQNTENQRVACKADYDAATKKIGRLSQQEKNKRIEEIEKNLRDKGWNFSTTLTSK